MYQAEQKLTVKTAEPTAARPAEKPVVARHCARSTQVRPRARTPAVVATETRSTKSRETEMLGGIPALARRTAVIVSLVALLQLSLVTPVHASVDDGSSTNSSLIAVACSGQGLQFSQPSGVNSVSASRSFNCTGGADIWISIWVNRTANGFTSEYDRIDVGPGYPYFCTNTTGCSAFLNDSNLPGGFYQVLSTASFRAYPDGNIVNFAMQGYSWTVPGGGPSRPNP